MKAFLALLLMCLASTASSAQESLNVHNQDVTGQDSPVKNRIQQVLESLMPSQEMEKRVEAAVATYKMMEAAGRYVSSIADILRDKEIPLPVGLKSSKYTICIEQLYNDSISNSQKQFIKVVCLIPTNNGTPLVFQGDVLVEGDEGMGTHGKISIITPARNDIGKEATIAFCEGTSLEFGCDGFHAINANLAFILKSDKIYSVDASGKSEGKLIFETQAKFSNLDDFTIAISSSKRLAVKGLDGYLFTIGNVVLDNSCATTPATASFPVGYFGGASAEESRNMWRGLAVANAMVELPEYMVKNGDENKKERPSLKLQNLIIDGSGISCYVRSQNISADKDIDLESWSMSVADFELGIERNIVIKAGFGGKVNIPPLGKNSLRDYRARYDIVKESFELESNLGGNLDFPMLCAKLSLDETSTISLELRKNGIYPAIKANGKLSIGAPVSNDTTKSKLSLPDIRFENMLISREKFELGTASLSGSLETPDLAGFQLSIGNIATVKNDKGQGIHLDASVTAFGEQIEAKAGIDLYGNEQKWRFNKVDISKIGVKFKSGPVSASGEVEFREGDVIYGKGFRGEIKLSVMDKFDLQAVGVFGKKDDYHYFLTDALFEVPPAQGVTVPPALSFYGIGGGLYRHMQQDVSETKSEFGKSLSGINYIPDNTVGMGFMARTKFCLLGSDNLFDADVNLEMQFNQHWGVNFIQLRGEATMLSISQQESMLQGIKKGLNAVEKRGGDIVQFNKGSLEAKPTKEGALTATVGMKYDMENDVFTADMKAYLDVAGVLTGRGPDNTLGWASAYFAKDKWYTYIGTPENRLGVNLAKIANAGGYFMIGNDIPELPELPDKVKQHITLSGSRKDMGLLSEGKGLAFGADLSVDLNANLPPFYAQLGIEMGSEMLLKKYSDAVHCKGRTGPIGINGWYANAQAWAWVNAAIGMKVKLFRKERKFDIINASMASVISGEGLNPAYFTGAVGGQFRLLGGLVKGKCNFKFEIGERCEMVKDNQFGEDVIAQLTPADQSKDVNVFVAPQLVLNMPANESMVIEEESGVKETYRISIAEFNITNTKTGIKSTCSASPSKDNRIWTFETDEPLESRSEYKVYAKVTFERLDGDKWVVVKGDNAQPYSEEKTAVFTSGERPKYILPEHVQYAYPADRQYNFLSDEHGEAYIMTSKNYSYLFTTDKPKGFDQKAQFTTIDGKTIDAAFTHKKVSGVANAVFEIDIPIKNLNLATNQIYNMAIVNVPQKQVQMNENISDKETKIATEAVGSDITETRHEAEGSLALLDQTEIYSIDFRTSTYRTFREKMKSFDVDDIIPWQYYPYVYSLPCNIYDNTISAELFDETEYGDVDYTKRMVQFDVDYDSMPWYKNHVAPTIYDNAGLRAILGNITPPSQPGIVTAEFRSLELPRLDDTMIASDSRPNKSHYGAIINNCLKYIDEDRENYRTKIANMASRGTNVNKANAFMSMDNIPPLIEGRYPVVVKYVLPGKQIETSKYLINLSYKK